MQAPAPLPEGAGKGILPGRGDGKSALEFIRTEKYMLTYTYISKGKFGLVEKPKPTIQHERDAIVKVTLASICSSDLHIKHGSVPRAVEGITVGHEIQDRVL